MSEEKAKAIAKVADEIATSKVLMHNCSYHKDKDACEDLSDQFVNVVKAINALAKVA
jgi:hypothetical protein